MGIPPPFFAEEFSLLLTDGDIITRGDLCLPTALGVITESRRCDYRQLSV